MEVNEKQNSVFLDWLKSHPYTVGAALLFAVLAVPFHRKTDSQWDTVYLRAADHLQAGVDMFRLQDGYLYPPFMAWLAIPFTHLPLLGARVAWFCINVVSMVLLWRWSWFLATGGSRAPLGRREHWTSLLGLAVALRYGIDCVQNQQTDLVIAALLLGGCVLLARNFDSALLAATCFGIAAGMKCTGLLFAPYLVWRGHWKAAAWLVVVAVGVNFLPNLARTPESGGWWLNEWVSRYLLLMTRADHSPGVWGSAALMNQSLSGAAYRWLMTDWSWTTTGFTLAVKADGVSPGLMKIMVYGGELALLLLTLVPLGRPGGVPSADRGNAKLPWECSLVLLLMVLLSPMSSKPHFCTLLLPAFLVARQAVQRGDRVSGTFLIAALATGAFAIKDLAGLNLASLAMWYGGVTWSAFLLLVGCGYSLRRMRNAECGMRNGEVRELLGQGHSPFPIPHSRDTAA